MSVGAAQKDPPGQTSTRPSGQPVSQMPRPDLYADEAFAQLTGHCPEESEGQRVRKGASWWEKEQHAAQSGTL